MENNYIEEATEEDMNFKLKAAKLISDVTKLSKNQVTQLLETPPSNLGDLAFPCFILSKTLKKSPNQIAEDLKKKIKTKDFKVETKGPYLNFFINKAKLAKQVLTKINKQR